MAIAGTAPAVQALDIHRMRISAKKGRKPCLTDQGLQTAVEADAIGVLRKTAGMGFLRQREDEPMTLTMNLTRAKRSIPSVLAS